MPSHRKALSSEPLLRVLCTLSLLAIFTPTQADSGASLVSIYLQDNFSQQGGCGHGCLYNTETDNVADEGINIEYHCSTNACYCTEQSKSLYSAFMTSCWSYACYNLQSGDPLSTIPPEIAFALSVYDGYCATAYPQSAKATTTSDLSASQTTDPSTGTEPSMGSSSPAPTASSPVPLTTTSAATSSAVVQPGLSPAMIGGIAGGVIGGVLVGAFIGAFIFMCLRSRRNKRNAQQIVYYQGPGQGQYQGYDRPHEKPELAANRSERVELMSDQVKGGTMFNGRAIRPAELY